MRERDRRIIEEANYYVNNSSTIRETAKKFHISKSAVHYDFNNRLSKIDKSLFIKVRTLITKNKAMRHLRGGLRTKLLYSKKG